MKQTGIYISKEKPTEPALKIFTEKNCINIYQEPNKNIFDVFKKLIENYCSINYDNFMEWYPF